MSPRQIPEALRVARRALEGMDGFLMLSDFQWNGFGRWMMHCRITLSAESSSIPKSTDWYVVVEPSYPWGLIRFYPAKKRGISVTFPHQQYNNVGRDDVPYRTGFLCLDTSVYALGRHALDRQPYDAHERLRWHIAGAVEWLNDAVADRLLPPGAHFELPQFPGATEWPLIVGFNENAESFAQWNQFENSCGVVYLRQAGGKPDVYITQSFHSADGDMIYNVSWGRAIESLDEKKTTQGIWLRLDSVPVLAPWQAPRTWEELRVACEKQGVSLYDLVGSCVDGIRDGKSHLALIGFPVFAKVGDEPSHLHWQAFRLPVLSWKKNSAGFPTTSSGYQNRDRALVFRDAEELQWIITENWHAKEISSRGKLPEPLNSKHVLIIGAGALGSVVAEMLARAGVHKITVIDNGLLDMGNLVRHTLHMGDLRRPKADALTERLSLVSPHTKIESIITAFPPTDEEDIKQAQSADIVIDTTAQDGILHNLEAFPWGSPKLFYSLSLGMKARKIYCYAAKSSSFPMEDFRTQINPLIAQDKEEFEQLGEELPTEGTGCWHRLFPARIDDVWMMAAASIKFIEGSFSAALGTPLLKTYEQVHGSDGFEGIRLVSN
jgi:molybdopterin/thiamine biosynthesis adenylyltransferase